MNGVLVRRLLACLLARMRGGGGPIIVPRDGVPGGIHEAPVWRGPGEPGKIYLQAVALADGAPLAAARLRTSPNCRSEWSNAPEERFFSAMRFTTYESDWGHCHAARFEVWLQPASGAPERKPFAKNYTIQGWQR